MLLIVQAGGRAELHGGRSNSGRFATHGAGIRSCQKGKKLRISTLPQGANSFHIVIDD